MGGQKQVERVKISGWMNGLHPGLFPDEDFGIQRSAFS
jgi:hypothetical protein